MKIIDKQNKNILIQATYYGLKNISNASTLVLLVALLSQRWNQFLGKRKCCSSLHFARKFQLLPLALTTFMVFSYDNYYGRHLLQKKKEKKKKRDCIYPLGPFCPLLNLLKDAFDAANVNIELFFTVLLRPFQGGKIDGFCYLLLKKGEIWIRIG